MEKYLLIDGDGVATLLNKKPELDACSYPVIYRVSCYDGAIPLDIEVECFGVNGWEYVMEIE